MPALWFMFFLKDILIIFRSLRFYYPTALRRVQITPKTRTNITRYLYSRLPVRQISCRCQSVSWISHANFFPLRILLSRLSVNKYRRNSGHNNLARMLDNKDQFLFRYAVVMLFFFSMCMLYLPADSEPLGYGVST